MGRLRRGSAAQAGAGVPCGARRRRATGSFRGGRANGLRIVGRIRNKNISRSRWHTQNCVGGVLSGNLSDTDSRRQQERGVQRLSSVQSSRGNDQRRRAPEHASGEWWEVEPDVGRVAHGVPARVDRLRGIGNAVVPYQALPIFEAIAEYELSQHLS